MAACLDVAQVGQQSRPVRDSGFSKQKTGPGIPYHGVDVTFTQVDWHNRLPLKIFCRTQSERHLLLSGHVLGHRVKEGGESAAVAQVWADLATLLPSHGLTHGSFKVWLARHTFVAMELVFSVSPLCQSLHLHHFCVCMPQQ